jgi:hypothetical protein
MKNKFKIVLVALVFAGLWSCTDEQNFQILEAKGDFQVVTPEAGTSIVLTPELQTNPAITLTWESADFTTPTQITYTVEMALTGTEFADIITAATSNGNNVTWTVADLNGAAVAAGLTPFTEGSVDVRVKASAGGQDQYSNVINLLITPYSTDLPKLAVPGNHQGWNPPSAPRIAASSFGETDYEGYVWLDGEFKFVGPTPAGVFDWGAGPDYGDDGSFSGVLVEQNESNCSAAVGYYRVRANTTTLTYSTEPTSWGIIGAATPLSWDNSTPLTYNATNKTWEGDLAMTAGEFKFRANGAWTINLGGDPDADGSMNYDGPNLSVAAAGNYHVVLDLSNPRQYTYTLTAN